jgi:hypothetical protein
MVAVTINDFSCSMSMVGFLGASLSALIGWYLGLAITRHPLLDQISVAARSIQLTAPRLRFPHD